MEYVSGKVIRVERVGHTVYGNPIIRIELGKPDGSWEMFRISDNASLVYAIDNPEFRQHWHTFKLTRAGRISGRYERSLRIES